MASSPNTVDRTELGILKPGDEGALEAFLIRHAASAMFLRANAHRGGLEDRGEFHQATYGAAFSGGEIVAVAAHCWNGIVVLQAPVETERVANLAIERTRRAVTGIVGPPDQARLVRRALRFDDRPALLDSVEDLFALDLADLALPPPLASGTVRCRRAEERDHPLLAMWRIAYNQEALGQRATQELGQACRTEVEVLCGEGSFFVLETDALVACCNFNARLPDRVQIGGVYTPLLLRGKGYARAVVAGALLAARSAGVGEAILFTGRNNRPAQGAYRALGFRQVGQYALFLFEA
jgi:RimJ/RimL family protein N-acetyltransferase